MLTNDERLALLVCIDKAIQPELKDAKAHAQIQMVELAEQGLADRKPVLVGGQKVGEVGVTYSSPKPVIIEAAPAMKFLSEHGLTCTQPVNGWERDFVQAGDAVVYAPTGEVVEGMQWEPARPKSATVRIKDTQAALNAFGDRLAGQDLNTLLLGSNSLLLEGGNK